MKSQIKPKPEFLEKMRHLLNQADFEKYEKIIQEPLLNSIRCNTLKIFPEELKIKLEEKNWKISQPFKNYPEVMIVENDLGPGELGRSIEHLLGYYYIQELASMLSTIALAPKPNELILDLCASPGSKTSQIASQIKNTGTIIANDVNIERIKILASNLERCGVANAIITREDGVALCEKLKSQGLKFDKILLDAPCSGEGTMRSSVKTCLMWNPNTIKSLSKLQKKLFQKAFEILKEGGEMIYSTCTHAPEENEEVVDFALKEFKDEIKIEEIKLPVKCREGIASWNDEKYDERVKFCARIYPQDNNSEGFFVAKFRRVK
ncbi:MAG: RsmB/NOP family class I SAM-dependent RNA methyltransferase [Nanoarchaeota archaeon]|nr:RsmB/NOP family class I SAM-dependent RNA methyltransferase [Nanoarchaeota archaeon]